MYLLWAELPLLSEHVLKKLKILKKKKVSPFYLPCHVMLSVLTPYFRSP